MVGSDNYVLGTTLIRKLIVIPFVIVFVLKELNLGSDCVKLKPDISII